MKKLLFLTALPFMFATAAQAKQRAAIIVSAYNEITIIDQATKIPANVLITDKICYIGSLEEIEQIVQKTIKNRGDFVLTGIKTLELATKTLIIAQIDTGIRVYDIQMAPCSR